MNILAELRSDATLHGTLIRCTAILPTKRHSDVAVSPEWGNKSCLNLIFYSKFNQVIAGSGIQKRQKLAAGRRVYDLVDTGQSKRILGACLVQAGVIYTHAPGLILLRYKDQIG